jgi:hypothetical protein
MKRPYTGNDLRLAFFSPLRHFSVNLIPQFGFDLSRVASEQCKKPLRPAVDHVDFVKRDRVHDFSPFLDLAFWALYESCLLCRN